MKIWKKFIGAAVLAAVCGSTALFGQEVRTIRLNNDLDQKYMTTKVYELKHMRCDDLTPWVLGAVYRYNVGSTVQRLNYKAGNKQYLVVTTGVDMMPYVDEMVAKMDRPCAQKDSVGSIVDGTGIYDFLYKPKFRSSSDMITFVTDCKSDGPTPTYNAERGIFYWKDSKSDGSTTLEYLQVADRPLPQSTMQINVYEIAENDFVELGLDWIAWKNGPGATLMGWGMDWSQYKSFSDVATDGVGNNLLADSGMGMLTGFMVAPQFDATFLRMLNQKGKAKVAQSGQLTYVNDYDSADPGTTAYTTAPYRLRFTPQYGTIQKSLDSNMNIAVRSTSPTYEFYLRKPTLCFAEAGDKSNIAMFGWVLRISNSVENGNDVGSGASLSGTNANEVYDYTRFYSDTTMALGTEKLLATYTREQKINQNDGIPYLQDIPGLKYVFGASADITNRTRVFVTVSLTPVQPDANLSPWAGEVVEAAKIANAKND